VAYHTPVPGTRKAYARLAGERAAARYANAEAKRYFSRALALTSEENLLERFDLLSRRVDPLRLLGERQDWINDVEALQQLAERMDDDGKRLQVGFRQALLVHTRDYLRL
jgi:hypothetical protein